MKTKKPVGKPLPPKFKHKVECDYFRKFTWKERIQILMGKNARLLLVVVSEHSTGKYDAALDFKLTYDLEPKPFLEITPPPT